MFIFQTRSTQIENKVFLILVFLKIISVQNQLSVLECNKVLNIKKISQKHKFLSLDILFDIKSEQNVI